MVRTDRWEKHRPGLADADVAKNGSTLSRASINRRGSGRRQMWSNWQADVSAMKPRRPEGEGSDLEHVRPVLRQGCDLCHPGHASHGKKIAGGHKPPNGAL
ncbi:hypothetical protein DXM21_03890 [Agrobacterium rosae]|nr:hypothetical protein DXM21_03890 [Agrobacterium rosae]KAA3524897.1 hypothetical protein DXM25_03890 [Agrobacterium rosae]MQB47318.1 hypothetical protein [Agrobacterium rosae]